MFYDFLNKTFFVEKKYCVLIDYKLLTHISVRLYSYLLKLYLWVFNKITFETNMLGL